VEDPRKAADWLAGLLADQRGAETTLALQRLGQSQRPRDQWRDAGAQRVGQIPGATATPRRNGGPHSVGVWQIVDTPTGPGLRRRSSVSPRESSVWSRDSDVPGKGDATRVVLVGESVARGFLLDPVLNPAMALRQYLRAARGGRVYQCVDLAQTAIQGPGLRRVITAAMHLDTDVLVVFAGNNWTTSAEDSPAADYPPSLEEVVRRDGYLGLRDRIRSGFLLPQVAALLADLERLRDQHGIRPVVVVPEFNLTGWSPLGGLREMDVPMLPEASLARWYELRSAAVSAVGAGEWATVRATAQEMAELDEGLSPVPGYLLGRALERTGEPEAAREAYERCRDSLWGLPVTALPRAPRVVQDMLRDFCARAGVECVDLPRLLGAAAAPALPDPAHFLDYCHLSDSGMAIAMSAVAAVITSAPCASEPAGAELISDWGRAVSLLLAACYNSFCDQPAAVVLGYLERAVTVCPRITGLMSELGRALDRPGGPLWSGPGIENVTREANAATVFARMGEYRPDRSRLWSLREGMARLAGAPPAGLPGSAPACGRRELLDISTTALGLGNVPNHTQPRCYLQANTPATEISVSLAAPAAGVLRLTHRRREGRADPVPVRVNGHLAGEFVATAAWGAAELAVPAGMTKAGVNVIEMAWPGAAVSWRSRIEQDSGALARGEHPYVLPIFGELYSVTWESVTREPARPAC
jgi:hypothetical protein